MVGYLRFCFALAVSLILLAIGVFSSFVGVMGIINGFRLHSAIMDKFEMYAAAGQTPPNIFSNPGPWLFSGGILAVGLALIVFGAIALRRRVAAGLPKQEDGEPKTRASWVAQLVFFGGVAMFGVYGVTVGLYELSGYATLFMFGDRTTAVIEKKWYAWESETGKFTG